MKLNTILLTALMLMGGSLSPALAQFITFGPNVKVVFTQSSETNEAGGTFIVTKATATVTETDPVTGTINLRSQTQVIVPDGSGGFTKIETQQTTVATLTSGTTYSVETTTKKLTTPVTASGSPVGATTTMSTTVTNPSVEFADLNLPASTEFYPIDDEFVFIAISPG